MPKYTRESAEAAGFTVDTYCYPWVAYKGPRFQPHEIYDCLTDLEALMVEALGVAVCYVYDPTDEAFITNTLKRAAEY